MHRAVHAMGRRDTLETVLPQPNEFLKGANDPTKTMGRAMAALEGVQKRVAAGRLKKPEKIGASAERPMQKHFGHSYYTWELIDGQLRISEHPVNLSQLRSRLRRLAYGTEPKTG